MATAAAPTFRLGPLAPALPSVRCRRCRSPCASGAPPLRNGLQLEGLRALEDHPAWAPAVRNLLLAEPRG
eukprot:7947663-Pyramimonas_sp.AAC.1